MAWRVMVTVLLMIAASQLLAAAGVVLVVSLLLTSTPMITRWLRNLGDGRVMDFSAAHLERPLATLVALLMLCALPWPARFDAPALIDFDASLRAATRART